MLPFSIDGRVAQHDIIKTMILVVLTAQLLTHDLGCAIKDGCGWRACRVKRALLDQRALDARAVTIDGVG